MIQRTAHQKDVVVAELGPMHWKQTQMLVDLVMSLNCSMGPSPWAAEGTNPGMEVPSLLWMYTSVLDPWDL